MLTFTLTAIVPGTSELADSSESITATASGEENQRGHSRLCEKFRQAVKS
jgi:hypothetical protein